MARGILETSLLPGWRRGGWSGDGDWTSLGAARAAEGESSVGTDVQARGGGGGVCGLERGAYSAPAFFLSSKSEKARGWLGRKEEDQTPRHQRVSKGVGVGLLGRGRGRRVLAELPCGGKAAFTTSARRQGLEKGDGRPEGACVQRDTDTPPSWAPVGRTQQDPRSGGSCWHSIRALPQLPSWTLSPPPRGGCSPLLKAVLGVTCQALGRGWRNGWW